MVPACLNPSAGSAYARSYQKQPGDFGVVVRDSSSRNARDPLGPDLPIHPRARPSWSRGPSGPRRHRYAPTAHDATRAIPDAHRDGGGDEVGDGQKIHQRKKPPPSRRGAFIRWPRISTLAGRGNSRGRLATSSRVVVLGAGSSLPPILSPPSHPVKTVPRASTIGVRARPGIDPARRASSDRAPSHTSGLPGPPHAARRRGVHVSVHARGAGRSAGDRRGVRPRPGPAAPLAWRACRRSPLGVGDFRTWLACREMLARRCTLDDGRSPTYGFAELARLIGVSEKRARASVNRLVGAGLLNWSDEVIELPRNPAGRATTPSPTPSAAARAPLPSPAASSDSWPPARDRP